MLGGGCCSPQQLDSRCPTLQPAPPNWERSGALNAWLGPSPGGQEGTASTQGTREGTQEAWLPLLTELMAWAGCLRGRGGAGGVLEQSSKRRNLTAVGLLLI